MYRQRTRQDPDIREKAKEKEMMYRQKLGRIQI